MDDAMEPALEKVENSVEGFVWMLPNIGLGLIVFAFFLAGAWAAKRTVRSLFRRRGRDDLGILLSGFAKWALVALGLLVLATIVFPSVQPADILATLGIGSVAIGFAFKDILQNWLSGLLILYRQPFRPGDQIVSGEFEGTVEHIEARATLIRTYDGQRVVIPNADIYTRAVTVRTAFPLRRSEYDVGIGYGDNLDRACTVLLEALKKAEGVARQPAPEAIPWALDASTVNVKLRWWSDSRRADVVETQGRVAAVRRAANEHGIDLPFPTQVVLFHDQTEESDGDRTGSGRAGRPAATRRRRATSTPSRSAGAPTARMCRRRQAPAMALSIRRQPISHLTQT